MKKYLFTLLLFNVLQICYGQIVVPKTPEFTNLEKQNPISQTSKSQVQVTQFPIKKELSLEEKKAAFRELQAEIKAEEIKEQASANATKGKAIYYETLAELEKKLQTSPNTPVKNAVFMVENAFYEKTLSEANYENQIQNLVLAFKNYAKSRNIDLTIYEAKMQALAEFYRDNFHYDFNDTRAKSDYQNYLVQKLLKTNTGQCHSMPLLFKILADELNLQTYLSFSPEHSFIKMKDSKGKIFSYEPTNGNFMSEEFIISSGFITPTARKTKIYNDTTNSYQTLVYCVYDLALSYKGKYGTDDFLLQCVKVLDKYNQNKLHAAILKADYYTLKSMKAIKAASFPPANKVYEMPEIRPLLLERDKYYKQLDDLGVLNVSVEDYEKWLKSTKITSASN
jgi:hypothetical protein